MRISDWSSDVCSSDLADFHMHMADQYKLMFQAMRGQGVVDEPLFEGVAELIERLDADGWLLGVATGKSDRGLNLCLASHGLSARFVTLQTADRHPSKRSEEHRLNYSH